MKRLTRRCVEKPYATRLYGAIDKACNDIDYLEGVYNKLGKLEDLEEQLGCPLDVLVKLVNGNPFCYEDENGMHIITSYNIETNTINFDDDWNDYDMELGEFGGVEVPFNQYKKSFWLKGDKSE